MNQQTVHTYLMNKPLVKLTQPFAKDVDVYKVNHKMFATLALSNEGETDENGEPIPFKPEFYDPDYDEWIDDYYLQCAAYSLAHNKVHGSNITQVAILLCTKDNIFQRFMVEGERLINYQNQFLEKVEQFYSQRMAN